MAIAIMRDVLMNVAPFEHFWKETSNIILARVSALQLGGILTGEYNPG